MNLEQVLAQLMNVLEQEQSALRRVLYRMKVCTLHLAGGDARFLARASDDLDEAQESLSGLELTRAVIVAEAAALIGIPESECTLSVLSAHASSHLQLAFEGFRNKSVGLVREIEELRGMSEQVAMRAVALVVDRIDRLTMSSLSLTYGDTYSPGTTASGVSGGYAQSRSTGPAVTGRLDTTA
jgi:hypothetical protein